MIEHGGDEDQAVAALLHDTVEDQGRNGRTRAEIEQKFGETALLIVLRCTDADTDPKPRNARGVTVGVAFAPYAAAKTP